MENQIRKRNFETTKEQKHIKKHFEPQKQTMYIETKMNILHSERKYD